MYGRRFLSKGSWVRELRGFYWVGQGKDLLGFLGPCVKLTDGPLSYQCGTGPFLIKMSQTDLVLKLV